MATNPSPDLDPLDRLLAAAPPDDEPVEIEDLEAIAEGLLDVHQGRVRSLEEVRAEPEG